MDEEYEDGSEYDSSGYFMPVFTHMSAARLFAIEEGCTVDGQYYKEDIGY